MLFSVNYFFKLGLKLFPEMTCIYGAIGFNFKQYVFYQLL